MKESDLVELALNYIAAKKEQKVLYTELKEATKKLLEGMKENNLSVVSTPQGEVEIKETIGLAITERRQ